MKSVFRTIFIFSVCLISQQALGQVRSADGHLLDQLKSTEIETRMAAIASFLSRCVDDGEPEKDFPALVAIGFTLKHDESPLVRALAARALEWNPDPRATEPLLSALRMERALSVRKAILYALTGHSSSKVVEELINQLDHKDAENRAVAAFALAKLNDPAAVRAAISFLQKRKKDHDVQASMYLIQLLGQQRDRSSIEILLKAIKSDNSPEMRRAAALALGKIGISSDSNILEQLRKTLLEPDPYLVAVTESAIRQIELSQ
jgi:HEAT repeat protein